MWAQRRLCLKKKKNNFEGKFLELLRHSTDSSSIPHGCMSLTLSGTFHMFSTVLFTVTSREHFTVGNLTWKGKGRCFCWFWERLKTGEEGDRGWDGWMASLTQWAWVWANSGRQRRTGKSGGLQSMGSQRVGHDWATEQKNFCWVFKQGWGFPGGSDGNASACNAGDQDSIPGSGRSPGEGNGYPLCTLAWKIPWTEEPGRLRSMGLQRVGCDWATSLSLSSKDKKHICFTLIHNNLFFFKGKDFFFFFFFTTCNLFKMYARSIGLLLYAGHFQALGIQCLISWSIHSGGRKKTVK